MTTQEKVAAFNEANEIVVNIESTLKVDYSGPVPQVITTPEYIEALEKAQAIFNELDLIRVDPFNEQI